MPSPELPAIDGSLHTLRNHFNLHRSKLRFMALLSPTCGPCLDGARAIKKAILDAFPDLDLAASIVWTDMLQGDNRERAEEASLLIANPRARHFYDPQRFAGVAFAQVLGGDGKAAWDTYLFYARDVEWSETPPLPLVWMHQLTESLWADAEHYHSGQDLIKALSDTAQRLSGQS